MYKLSREAKFHPQKQKVVHLAFHIQKMWREENTNCSKNSKNHQSWGPHEHEAREPGIVEAYGCVCRENHCDAGAHKFPSLLYKFPSFFFFFGKHNNSLTDSDEIVLSWPPIYVETRVRHYFRKLTFSRTKLYYVHTQASKNKASPAMTMMLTVQ